MATDLAKGGVLWQPRIDRLVRDPMVEDRFH